LGADIRIRFTIFGCADRQQSPKLRELLVLREDSNLHLGFRRERLYCSTHAYVRSCRHWGRFTGVLLHLISFAQVAGAEEQLPMLYPLSYERHRWRTAGFEPATVGARVCMLMPLGANSISVSFRRDGWRAAQVAEALLSPARV
jgi:hypothetical protein